MTRTRSGSPLHLAEGMLLIVTLNLFVIDMALTVVLKSQRHLEHLRCKHHNLLCCCYILILIDVFSNRKRSVSSMVSPITDEEEFE